jgi:two-component system chemotaxis response regulator CheB
MGASAGGIEAITRVLAEVPADIPAAFFVVVHLNAAIPSMLASVLGRRARLRVVPAEDGMLIECSTIYTASPDRHLLIEPSGRMRLGRGPRENNFRPAVDPLFRTAAASFGPNVIGVILSGALDDGTAGLLEVKRHGGVAIVQQLNDAMYAGMPASALQEVPAVDHVLRAAQIASVIIDLAGTKAAPATVSSTRSLPSDIAMGGGAPVTTDERAIDEGTQSTYGCPACGGVLWELRDGELVRYRCRVGHMFSDEALLAAQTENLETALWTALRALEEADQQAGALAARMRARGHARLADRFERQQQDAVRRAEIVRRALTSGQGDNDQIREID